MELEKKQRQLISEEDIVRIRREVKELMESLKFKIIDQTKVTTAVSEIARNTVLHGDGGTAVVQVLNSEDRTGIKICFEDNGKGIEDIELALKDGYTTGSGLGLGLGGAKRLVDEFYIESEINKGTKVTLIKWK